jgi:hypothetical protein
VIVLAALRDVRVALASLVLPVAREPTVEQEQTAWPARHAIRRREMVLGCRRERARRCRPAVRRA